MGSVAQHKLAGILGGVAGDISLRAGILGEETGDISKHWNETTTMQTNTR